MQIRLANRHYTLSEVIRDRQIILISPSSITILYTSQFYIHEIVNFDYSTIIALYLQL